ncbi:LAETG motif-containing sortase-dependent surface protein [Streptomyces sp. AK02-04a]|uniref:LAETG motif-containing sortase-dependent surface protein n=1 Tax=Streptomyces sp. AK02-04a TaxID=3028649 RepID=UPI0029B2826F|nr:LAETG motif-containing sortase-dependent surface protein [Streptomyces sp. AK02-04a]MDX3763442.1 LAETG motif-containing sortase-dependent surface protein [Streptomyces sp. AK02-04a]
MTTVLRSRVALASALSAAVLIAAPLVGTQAAHAQSYPPSPSSHFYPPHNHPGENQHPGGRPDHHDGDLAHTGIGMQTGMVAGGAVALIAGGIGAVLAARRRRNF